MRVAVMQPYFYPYMGYVRLMAAVDVFVLFDCVQFPRRGRVHRSQLSGAPGSESWLTLPLQKSPRDTRIAHLAFPLDAGSVFETRIQALPWAHHLPDPILRAMRGPFDTPVAYLERNLRALADHVGLNTDIRRSSDLALPSDLRRGARVRAAARAVGGTHYLNAPGGRALYSAQDFAADGLTLEFLAPYDGPAVHMLPALTTISAGQLARDAIAFERQPA